MDVRDSFKNATRAIMAAKMRSFLTMLGIIIGIAAVVMLMGVGNGYETEYPVQNAGIWFRKPVSYGRDEVERSHGWLWRTRRSSWSVSSNTKITMDDLTYIEENSTIVDRGLSCEYDESDDETEQHDDVRLRYLCDRELLRG